MGGPAMTAAWRAAALAAAGLGALACGCELVAGIDDRALSGAFDGPTTGGGAGGGGAGGGGAGGGGAGAFAASWPDSATQFCTDGKDQLDPCPDAPNLPYYGQDGSYVLDLPHYEVAGPYFRDETTGLVWRSVPAAAAEWNLAYNACGALREQGADGFDDWRLPTRRELVSLIDYGHAGTIHADVQDGGNFYWTLTLSAVNEATDVWIVMNDTGRTEPINREPWWDATGHALCVAGTGVTVAFAPVPLVATADGFEDPSTGLTWQATHSDGMAWSNALEFCLALGDKWRLPSVKELLTLVDDAATNPAISSVFTGVPNEPFWTSSPHRNQLDQAWSVEFSTGKAEVRGVMDAIRVRCVR